MKEKIKDLENKYELQGLKNEETMLELESIRAKRERLQPVCPHCNTQTIQLYHTHQQQIQLQNYQTLHKNSHNVAVQTTSQTSYTDTVLNNDNKLKEQQMEAQAAKNIILAEAKPKYENKETNTEKIELMTMTKDESINVNITKQEIKNKIEKV